MVKLSIRRAFVAAALALAACAPLVGLDELHDRPVDDKTPDSSDAGDARVDDGGSSFDAEAGRDAAPECTTHAQCNTGASTNIALCVEGHCKPVDRKYCQNTVLPTKNSLNQSPLFQPNPLIVAAFTPMSGTKGSVLAYELALEELDHAGGLTLTPRYDLVMLLCASEQELAEGALKHVVNDLKIPAIIANFDNDVFPKYVADITRPNGVFVLNPNVTPQALKFINVAPNQTVLNLLGTLEDVSLSYRRLVQELSDAVRKRKNLPAGAPLKIVLVTTDTFGEQDMSVALQQGARSSATADYDPSKALDINGTSPADAGSAFFRSRKIAPIPFDATEVPHYPDVVTDLASFRPDIVIALTGQEIETLAPDLDNALIAMAKSDPDGGTVEQQKILPVWVLGPRNAERAGLLQHLLGSADESTTTRLGRFRGIQYAGSSDKAATAAWKKRMDDRYNPDGGTPPVEYKATENFYDAVYWLGYGFYRGKRYDATATDRGAFTEGVRHLFGGENQTVPVGPGAPGAVSEARAWLDLHDAPYIGALGRPDIDKQFATWHGVGTVYCYETQGTGPAKTIVVHPDAQRYLDDGGVSVDFTCPDPQ